MPRLSIWFIRTAIVYLMLGFTAGGLLLIHKGINLHPKLWLLLPIHIEWVLIGWTFQLAMGVAFWILPRFAKPPIRGNESLVILSYLLLNIGILAILVDSFLQSDLPLSLAARISEGIAVTLFAIHAYPRIRAFGD